jgi:hypothetical protein
MLENSMALTDLSCSAAVDATHLKKVRAEEVAESGGVLENADKIRQEQEQFADLRKQLTAILKAYFFVSDDLTACVVPSIDISPDQLKRILQALSELRGERAEEIRRLQDKVRSQRHHCLAYSSQLAELPNGSLQKYKLAGRLARARSYYASMKNHLTDMRVDTYDQRLAKALGIPEEVIDTASYDEDRRARRNAHSRPA